MSNIDRLWAPWRVKYIRECSSAKSKTKKSPCIFCSAIKDPVNKFVVAQNKTAFAVLNIYPYNNGHLMVAPRRHAPDIGVLDEEECLDLFKMLNYMRDTLKKVLNPEGFNIGINEGRVSGAGIPGHLHMHIVPRWKGDTNFMPVTSSTKVVSQSLQELLTILKDAKAKRVKGSRR